MQTTHENKATTPRTETTEQRPLGTEIPLSYSMFQQPWWLDAVAPGQWSVAEVRHGSETVARLPYVKRKKFGLTYLVQPSLTPTLGPWFKPSAVKYARRLRQEMDWTESLLAQLPRYDYCSITCDSEVTNVLPFHWAGFELRLRYTYTISDIQDQDRVWSGFLSNIRSDIRKAQKQVVVREDLGLDDFVSTLQKTFRRQNRRAPFSREFLHRVDAALSKRGQRLILSAVDAREQIHAVVYLVWDHRKAYYLIGGGDPDLRSSGATSLLIWHAIQRAAAQATIFDFEGSMIEPIERFFRAFGAVQTPYFKVTRCRGMLAKAAMAVRGMTR